MPRSLSASLLTAAISLLAAGCGSSSSSTSSTASVNTPAQGTSSTQSATQTGTTSTPSGPSGGTSSSQTPEKSIKTYGSAASTGEAATISAGAFSFFRAMASSDYAKLCQSLPASNRKQMQAFVKAKKQNGSCPAILKTLIATRGVPAARKAAAGRLISVRVKGTTAFVIFKPRNGGPSYFVMRREGSAWKASSLEPGTPLNPLAG
ncbi:MAG TPA: hypothetical protein VND98_04995 [Solirubrobacterales bacterium]|nr:hypothetical protein [Solirubrobacterales bacterium]